jgi:hypothetical protein
MRMPQVPHLIAHWRREHPGEQIPDGQVAGLKGSRRDQVTFCQDRHDRGRRTRRGIDVQVKRAEQAVAGNAPVIRTQ